MVDLGLDKSDLGILGSILSLTYGMSKFLSGVLADRSNPRYFMAIGLILTGCFNILFGLTSSVVFLLYFGASMGFFRGGGGLLAPNSLLIGTLIKKGALGGGFGVLLKV